MAFFFFCNKTHLKKILHEILIKLFIRKDLFIIHNEYLVIKELNF